jgi:hypothetical protein
MKAFISVMPLMVAACVGCQTHQSSHSFESATSAALAVHHFAPPKFVRDANQVTWAVASRPQSDSAVQVAYVRLKPDGRSDVELTSYQYVGSDWATVGRLFDEGRSEREAAQMEWEIHNNLRAR